MKIGPSAAKQAAEKSLNEGHGFSRAVKSHSNQGF
jgi:hypothetical protein